jgi:hypothetical protein
MIVELNIYIDKLISYFVFRYVYVQLNYNNIQWQDWQLT